ncbi:MAG TPA: alpha/beta hydrolase [Legionella sp.]|nr:alpha/beta hydrolase [Legionella sp.]
MKDVVHFAHGNGFPSPCYHQLLSRLQTRYDCYYIDRVGHDHRFPVTDNWRALVDEVILSIQSQAKQPVIAVGHSLGGILSLLASIEQPCLFKSVILLDSPLLGRFKSSILRLSKMLGMIDHVTPAFRTKGRRDHWQTREAAFAYLKSRKLFKHFTPACLHDYIEYGLNKDDEGYTLRFDPSIEYQIYRTIPHVLHRYKGGLSVPCALIYGNMSNVINSADVHYMKTHHQMASYETNGSHMFPMEHPEAVADLIFNAIDAFE